MKKHIVTMYWKKGQELNLTKAFFRLMKTSRGGLFVDTIWFNKRPDNDDAVFTYDEILDMKTIFYVKKPKASGWSTYKTFKGLMSRLYEETYKLKSKNHEI